jgi:hypothetical protein
MLLPSPEEIVSSRLTLRVRGLSLYFVVLSKQSSIAHNLTTWGYDDCQANTSDGAFGGMLTKLLFRHLPYNYPERSTYAHFPFMVPKKMKESAAKLPGNLEPKYDWRRPDVPVGLTLVAKKYSDVQQLLAEPAVFTSGVAERLNVLTFGVQLNDAHVGPPYTDRWRT